MTLRITALPIVLVSTMSVALAQAVDQDTVDLTSHQRTLNVDGEDKFENGQSQHLAVEAMPFSPAPGMTQDDILGVNMPPGSNPVTGRLVISAFANVDGDHATASASRSVFELKEYKVVYTFTFDPAPGGATNQWTVTSNMASTGLTGSVQANRQGTWARLAHYRSDAILKQKGGQVRFFTSQSSQIRVKGNGTDPNSTPVAVMPTIGAAGPISKVLTPVSDGDTFEVSIEIAAKGRVEASAPASRGPLLDADGDPVNDNAQAQVQEVIGWTIMHGLD